MTTLAHLKEFSALLAQDINQVQAAGGNISLKTSDRLWIKASGKWLADAVLEEIFIDVPLAGASATLSSPLKPSIETSMHLALSAKIVVHTHALNILSYAVQTDGEVILKKLLAAFSPFWIPYAQPGESLTSAIKKSAPADAQILLLQNHGIIITGASCQEVFKRYQQVMHALPVTMRFPPLANLTRLEALAQKYALVIPQAWVIQSLATDPTSLTIFVDSVLYPDQVVFFQNIYHGTEENLPDTASCFVIPHVGVLVSKQISQTLLIMLEFHARLLLTLPDPKKIYSLPQTAISELLNWDAEKYRQQLMK